MEGLVTSTATGALKPIIQKLAALLGDNCRRFKRVRGEIKFLAHELDAMHAFLLKMSEEENPDPQDRVWMKEVQELSYDIEDSLDEFMVGVDQDLNKPDGFINRCKNLISKTKTRHRIAKAIQELKIQVKEVAARNARYRKLEAVAKVHNRVVDPRALAIFENASKLVGISRPKIELIGLLTKENGPTVVSIVGLGGLGKTTLAYQVYQEIKGGFTCQAFLTVSRNPNLMNVLRNILFRVSKEDHPDIQEWDMPRVIEEIRKVLKDKRYLIVIDDIWAKDAWEIISHALVKDNNDSKIITTTRMHDVAQACCTSDSDFVYKMKPLDNADSKMLFFERMFGSEDKCPANFVEVSNKILGKCDGLPLAIISISGLLANKPQRVDEWYRVQNSIGQGLGNSPGAQSMMQILSLSYFDLPNHLKTCLLYLSIFPEDYVIETDCLVRKWIAEGFIEEEEGYTLYELGERCFNELINRSLIQPGGTNKIGEVGSCQVHDIILDFIVTKSKEDNFITVYGILNSIPPPENKVRRLSLHGNSKADTVLLSKLNVSNLRSLISSFGYYGESQHLCLNYRFLRILDLQHCESLDNQHLKNIGKLFLLKYLSLRGTSISALPEQIGELQCLQTLDIRQCSITEISTAVVLLKKLVHLLLNDTVNISVGRPCFNLPCGIRDLHALEELKHIVINVSEQPAGFLEEIGELSNLRDLAIVWYYRNPEVEQGRYREYTKMMVSSLCRLHKLHSIYLSFPRLDIWWKYTINGDDFLLEKQWCPASIRKLEVNNCSLSKVPSWMDSLVNLVELKLPVRNFRQEDLDILGILPVLVHLHICLDDTYIAKEEDCNFDEDGDFMQEGEDNDNSDEDRDYIAEQLKVSNKYGFRNLRCLEMTSPHRISWPQIPMLSFEDGSMPNLEELSIEFNSDITSSGPRSHFDFGLQHLPRLNTVHIRNLGSETSVLSVEAAIRRALDNHPNRPSLDISTFYNGSKWEFEALNVPVNLCFAMGSGNAYAASSARKTGCLRFHSKRRTRGALQGPSSQTVAACTGTPMLLSQWPTPGAISPEMAIAPMTSRKSAEQRTLPPSFNVDYARSITAHIQQSISGCASIEQSPAQPSWDQKAFVQTLTGQNPSVLGRGLAAAEQQLTAAQQSRDGYVRHPPLEPYRDQNALGSTFRNLSLQQFSSNNNWSMDSDATDHMTDDAGPSDRP